MAKLLIIDDQIDLLCLYQENLVEAGHEATIFSDSNMALEHINNNPNLYDLIISDFVMPALNGIELFNAIVKEHKDKFSNFLIHSSMNPNEIKTLVRGQYSPIDIVSKAPSLSYITDLVERYLTSDLS